MKPLITVAIPLYRSSRFLPIIYENIGNLSYPNLEILVSDRHGLDNAAEQIADRYRQDERISILKADDGIGWIDHYNHLLKIARGEFFMWMPHDDSFPRGYLEELSGQMIRNREVAICYGSVRPLNLDGIERQDNRYTGAAGKTRFPPGFVGAMVFYMAHPWVPFRGLIRRSVALESGLYLEHCVDDYCADANWVMAMLHSAPLMHVPAVRCDKRFYSASTHRAVRVSSGVIRSSTDSLAQVLMRLGYSATYARALAIFAYFYRNLRRMAVFGVMPKNLIHRLKIKLLRG